LASGRYELTCRAFPQQTAAAQHISPEYARSELAAKFCEWHPNSSPRQLARLFGWPQAEAMAACDIKRRTAKRAHKIGGSQ
jgi:hypothetical protein